jgi:hypothetical protein
MNAALRRVYWVSRPSGTVRPVGEDFAVSGAVTGALITTQLSGDRTGWFRCHTRAVPAENLRACLAPGAPARAQVRDRLTDTLTGAHTHGGRRRRSLSGAELAGEAERILEDRDYASCHIDVDGVPEPGVRVNSSLFAADEATGVFLAVHHRHLVVIESHDGAGVPQALTTASSVTAMKTS